MKNNRGFSLIEIMIAVGILGVVVAASGTTLIYFSKMLNRVEARQDMISLSSQLQTIITSKSTCEQSMGLEGSSDLPFHLAQAKKATNFNTPKGFPVSMSIPGDNLLANAQLSTFPLKVNYLHINDAKLAGKDNNGWDVYTVNLNASFSSTRPSLGSEYTRGKNIGSFLIKVDNSDPTNRRLKSCFSLNPNDPASLEEFAKMMCEKMDGTYDEKTKLCENIAQSCKPSSYSPTSSCSYWVDKDDNIVTDGNIKLKEILYMKIKRSNKKRDGRWPASTTCQYPGSYYTLNASQVCTRTCVSGVWVSECHMENSHSR